MSRLVTHPDVLVPVANTPDGPPATAASAPRSPALGSAFGSPAGQTIAANSDVFALSDTQPCHSIADRSDAGDRVGTTRRSACTCVFASASSRPSSSAHDPHANHDPRRRFLRRKASGRREEDALREALRRTRRTRKDPIFNPETLPRFQNGGRRCFWRRRNWRRRRCSTG
jgi:hypothetical protein